MFYKHAFLVPFNIMFPLKCESSSHGKRGTGTDSHTSLRVMNTERHHLTGLTFLDIAKIVLFYREKCQNNYLYITLKFIN